MSSVWVLAAPYVAAEVVAWQSRSALRQANLVFPVVKKQFFDLALFNLAINSKPLGCDVVAIGVDDVAPNDRKAAS